ncbi:MAG TPA: hypothetical protein VK629_06295 [Steroidobacteraceae bacterium]|nr:hypothetical protein [Steroidobacteraceae bacterium]
MSDEPELEISPMSQLISSGGCTVNVQIYRLVGGASWTLEVEDEFGNSTVWDDTFPSESAALTEAKNTILAEGVGSLIGPEDGKGRQDGWK